MRDIIISIIIFGSLPFILRRPFVGVLMWTWIGLMNPHRLAWGFSTNFPFAMIVFGTTVLAYIMSREAKRIPISREIILLGILVSWMWFTTMCAMFPVPAWEQFDKVWKIQLGVLLTLMLTNSRERLHQLVFLIAISIGFYGLKGGLWTILHGGANRVYGPSGSFIAGNNEIGLAMIMTAPFIWYLAIEERRPWLKNCYYVWAALTLIAIVGTHSRGALLGLAVGGFMLLMKAKRKMMPLLVGIVFVATLPQVMPQEWFDRMHTIETYEEDKSAQGRIKAWNKSIIIANSRPTGGGFEALRFTNGVDAHSIYFEMLSEHGYIGLTMFVSLGFLVWFKAGRIKRLTKRRPDLQWAHNLSGMIQVSIAGYAVSGAFLGLSYFDLVYVIIVLTVVMAATVDVELAKSDPAFDVSRSNRLPEPRGMPVVAGAQLPAPSRLP